MAYSRAVESLAKMISFKTISVLNEPEANKQEFDGFVQYLQERYPKVFEKSAFERVGSSGLIMHLSGKRKDSPSVLMSHYDVVEVTEGWQVPPFAGEIKDGVVWGRGTLDTKITLCAAMEASEALLAEGLVLQNDLYLAFAGDEEIGGGPSAPAMVDWFESKGLRPGFVLDEGGAIVSNIFPGVDKECAVIGIAEKGFLNLMLTARAEDGHASAPPKKTALGKLAKAIARIERSPFPQRLISPVRKMLGNLGGYSSNGFIRFLFTNLWLTAPLVKLVFANSGGELAAMTRTTCAFTMATASKQANVLPKAASATANFRILQGESAQSTMERISRLAGSEIEVTNLYSNEPSKISEMDERYELLADTIRENWQDILVTPYLMMACTDSRHYGRISDHVYRFSPVKMSKEDRALIHADNERIDAYKVDDCVAFYKKLIVKL